MSRWDLTTTDKGLVIRLLREKYYVEKFVSENILKYICPGMTDIPDFIYEYNNYTIKLSKKEWECQGEEVELVNRKRLTTKIYRNP